MKKPLLLLGIIVLFGCSSESLTNQQKNQKDADDSAAVETAMLANREKYFECYTSRFLNSEKWPAGRVLTQFLIDKDGRVAQAEIKQSTLKQPQVENCLLKVIKSSEFPKPKNRGTVSVEYPFSFKGKDF